MSFKKKVCTVTFRANPAHSFDSLPPNIIFQLVDSFSGADEGKLRKTVETHQTQGGGGGGAPGAGGGGDGADGDGDEEEVTLAHATVPLLQNRFLNALSGLALESAMGNAPELISQIMADAQKATITWERLTDSGWRAYPDEVTIKLETEYRLNHATVRISVLSEGWTVQFLKDGTGVERPVRGGGVERAVRRVQHDAAAAVEEERVFEATKVVLWNAGRYPPYPDPTQQVIESAFQAQEADVHISVAGRGGYRIVFSYDGGRHAQISPVRCEPRLALLHFVRILLTCKLALSNISYSHRRTTRRTCSGRRK